MNLKLAPVKASNEDDMIEMRYSNAWAGPGGYPLPTRARAKQL